MEEEKNPFDYVKPTEMSTEKIKTIRSLCKTLNEFLVTEIKPSRERSTAITKLEEVSMWANKGIVFNQED